VPPFEEGPGHMIRVLLVEDNPGDARYVREILQEQATAGFDLTHAPRLSDALRRLGENAYDAILLDLGLPDARGLEAVQPLKNAAPHLPIVVLSGLQDQAMALEAVQRGAQDYLVKGQGNGELLARALFYAIERNRSERRINFLAHHDGLTNLPNRRLLLDRLEQALARTRRNRQMLALLFLDLDHFKSVNDTLGHAVGDLLLQNVARRLKACTRESDTIARLGGDEFTLILPEVSRLEDVSRFAAKIFDALNLPYMIEGQELFVSASMGISIYPTDGEEAETLLRNADAAMYRAKQQGGNMHQFYLPALYARASRRLAMASGLRHALEREELVLHYQPQIDLRTGRIAGMEALVRWQHPELGLVPPGQFIPFAEETGLIAPMDDWILLRACEQARAWHDAGFPHIRLAVNLSARNLHQTVLAEKVGRALRQSGLDPSDLELELTESGIMHGQEATLLTMQKLSALGVRLAIDDFGTGYSSLSRLREFPIRALKIDQTFVRDISADGEDAAIVDAIITMGHGLRLEVTAEGVETPQQLDFLRRHACDRIQGFYMSHPVTVPAMTELLRAGRSWGNA
jgi:diguanylate cyclase (GGDEF)-like protein